MIKYALPVAVLYFAVASTAVALPGSTLPQLTSPNDIVQVGSKGKGKGHGKGHKGHSHSNHHHHGNYHRYYHRNYHKYHYHGRYGPPLQLPALQLADPRLHRRWSNLVLPVTALWVNLDDRVVEDEYRAVGRVATVSLLIANGKL